MARIANIILSFRAYVNEPSQRFATDTHVVTWINDGLKYAARRGAFLTEGRLKLTGEGRYELATLLADPVVVTLTGSAQQVGAGTLLSYSGDAEFFWGDVVTIAGTVNYNGVWTLPRQRYGTKGQTILLDTTYRPETFAPSATATKTEPIFLGLIEPRNVHDEQRRIYQRANYDHIKFRELTTIDTQPSWWWTRGKLWVVPDRGEKTVTILYTYLPRAIDEQNDPPVPEVFDDFFVSFAAAQYFSRDYTAPDANRMISLWTGRYEVVLESMLSSGRVPITRVRPY